MKTNVLSLLVAIAAGSLLGGCSPEPNPMGLVLAGGGGKGAYEIGVWKAFCETGVDKRIKVYSGSSVGAINATLFAAVGDPSQCVDLWKEAVGQVFSCNKKEVQKELDKTADDLDTLIGDIRKNKKDGEPLSTGDKIGAAAVMALSTILRMTGKANDAMQGPSNSVGFCDSAQLRKVLAKSLPSKWRPNPPLVYVTALSKVEGASRFFLLNGNDRGRVIDYLMASAAIPGVFDSVEIDGVLYVDGGYEKRGGDNIPLRPIRERHPEIHDVFVVYLESSDKLKRRLKKEEYPNGRIIEIMPSRSIGGSFGGWEGVFDMSDEKVSGLIKLGYIDAMRVLREYGFAN